MRVTRSGLRAFLTTRGRLRPLVPRQRGFLSLRGSRGRPQRSDHYVLEMHGVIRIKDDERRTAGAESLRIAARVLHQPPGEAFRGVLRGGAGSFPREQGV